MAEDAEADAELQAQLLADLDGVELSDDEDEEPSAGLAALEELPSLVPIEELLAAAEAEATASAVGSSALDDLAAALDATGARACEGFAADVSEMAGLTAGLELPAPRPAWGEEGAAAADAAADGASTDGSAAETPWWVEERQAAWAA